MAIKDDMEDVQEAVINELITENGITNTLADGQVTEAKIASGAVTTTKIADGAIIASKLSSAISFAPAANSLNSGQLADNAVTRPKIADNSVSTAKLYDDAVTTAKIDDDAVTPAKLDRAYLESTGGSVSGNVGIGTSSPSHNLHVEDTSASIAVISDTSGNSTILLGDTADNNKGRIIYTQSIDALKLLTNGSEAMRVSSSGNVGIGTTPQSFAKLQVKTDTNKHIAMFTNAVGATIGGITDTGGSAALRIAGSPLIMTGGGGAGSEHMRIQADGTIKISNSSAPATPTNGGVLFVQSGILRFKGQNGTVTDLAQP